MIRLYLWFIISTLNWRENQWLAILMSTSTTLIIVIRIIIIIIIEVLLLLLVIENGVSNFIGLFQSLDLNH
jgi:hypothetical protein